MAPAVLRTILDYPDKAKHHIRTRPRFTVAGAPPPAAFIERLERSSAGSSSRSTASPRRRRSSPSRRPDHATPRRRLAAPRARRRAGPRRRDPACSTTTAARCRGRRAASARSARARTSSSRATGEQPEETAKAIHDGYFHTGDLAVWDEIGNIHIVDRKKDVIISGGENISSPEIEDALYQHPAVLECAVIGVPHEKWGETPKALVVLRAGADARRGRS